VEMILRDKRNFCRDVFGLCLGLKLSARRKQLWTYCPISELPCRGYDARAGTSTSGPGKGHLMPCRKLFQAYEEHGVSTE
jgi:hypothetical protein